MNPTTTLELRGGLTVLYPMAIATTCDHSRPLHLNCGACAYLELSPLLEEMDRTLAEESK